MKKKILLIALALLLAIGLVAISCAKPAPVLPAPEGEFPTKPITVIIPYNPGGASDFQARIVTMMSGMEDYLGQPTVIVNKPGAGGMVGWNWFTTEGTKDGYMLTGYNIPHFIAQSIVYPKKAEYSIRVWEPVINWGADPATLVVGADSPFDTVDDLVAYARENPGKVTLTGAGLFVGHHIAFLQLATAADVELTYVPHTGGVPALTAVIAGESMAGFNNLSDAYRSKDRLKILAIADLQRNTEFLPDVPTLMELGYDIDDTSNNCRGLAAPAGTPPAILKILRDAYYAQLSNKNVIGKMAAGGSPMWPLNADELRKVWGEREAFLKGALAEYVEK
ncbi:hypothetical protein ES703_69738 [subsurface metagenome]